MKLIFCRNCQDVFKVTETEKKCKCELCSAISLDGTNSLYKGPAVPIGFNNTSLVLAIQNQPESGQGEEFIAFVIPKTCGTFIKL